MVDLGHQGSDQWNCATMLAGRIPARESQTGEGIRGGTSLPTSGIVDSKNQNPLHRNFENLPARLH